MRLIRCLPSAVAALLSVLPVSAACADDPAQQVDHYRAAVRAPGLRMVERLARVRDLSPPALNRYLNCRRADRLQLELEQTKDIGKQVNLKMKLADELLCCGRTATAIDLLTELRGFATGPTVRPNPRLIEDVTAKLAISFLRQAEEQNCCARHTPDSCIWPIRGLGKHEVKRPAEEAIKLYLDLLNRKPGSPGYHWLLNLSAMTLPEYPANIPERYRLPAQLFKADYDIQRFVDVAPAVGLDVSSLAGGVALEDFDNDGLLDVICSGWGLHEPLRYLHNDGNGRFTDRTEEAGLVGQLGGLNLNHTDFNNDGFADVLVLRGAWLGTVGDIPNSLLRNNGDGTFTDVTETAGMLSYHPTQTAAWADYDNDGWVDVFIGNETTQGDPHPCEFFHNNGDGTFTERAGELGLAHTAFVKGVGALDYDNDGRMDLYLSCFSGQNVLFRNRAPEGGNAEPRGEWRFEDVTATAKVASPTYCFPVMPLDFDNDGDEDLFVAAFASFVGDNVDVVVADMVGAQVPAERCALHRNNGDGTFTDIGPVLGLNKVTLAMGGNFGDLDNDGFLDIYLGTGQPSFTTLVPNLMFRNAAAQRFQNVTISGGFGHLQKGHGIAWGDVDNDGDQDILAEMGGAYFADAFPNALFLNPGHGARWITLKLVGQTTNRAAVGARVRVEFDTPAGPRQVCRTVGTGGSFGSSSLQQEIGLADATTIRAIDVRWPTTGQSQRFQSVELDRAYELVEGVAELRTLMRKPIRLGDANP